MPHYATPLDFRKALEARLRNEAQNSHMSLDRLRQLIVFDRFITRIFSVFGDQCILKGGVVVEFRLGGARTTKDIDLRLSGSPDAVLSKLQQAGRLELGDFLSFEVVLDPKHPDLDAEGMAYKGMRFQVEPKLAGKLYGNRFKVDVGFADALEGDADEISGSSFLSFADIEPSTFRVYPIETHIAEKLHAYTLPRKRENSRIKDLPDIALLASVRNIDAQTLLRALRKTFDHRNTHPLPVSIPDPPTFWVPRYTTLAEEDHLPWHNLDELLAAVRQFLEPMLTDASGTWNPQSWSWKTRNE